MTHPPQPPPGEPEQGYGQPGYGQQGGYPQQPGYPQQVGGAYAEPPNAPGAVASLVLGLIGITFCGLCAPFAWAQGRKAETAAETSGGAYGGKGMASAGKILGIIGTVFLVLAVVGILLFVIAGIFSASYETY
ncbi:MAG: DUF4190 domain-containing protein [Thermoleophilaceae bacterium]